MAEGKVRIPKQKRSIEKKNSIFLAAIELFSEKGIHAITSKEIAAKAGVSIGSFYSYFADKKSLFLNVLEHYLEQHFLIIWGDEEVGESVVFSKDLIRYYMENLLQAYGYAPEYHRQSHALRYTDPDVKALFDAEYAREITRLKQLLKSMSGQIRPIDIDAVAPVIQCAAENLAHTIYFKDSLSDETAMMEAFVEMIYRWLLKEDA